MKHDNSKCMHCEGCAAVCPTGAITVYETFVKIDEILCTKCGNCVKICPVGAIT
ncbi:MAG: 4Fe-4S binding protein [Thermoplasmatales archaeon]|nr:4Fe-4S binding protein [Thermoplasmatales archaeon]